MRKEKDYFKEIDSALKDYEEYKSYKQKGMDWICDRIDWCWKWRKITKEQMESLADRAIAINERSY